MIIIALKGSIILFCIIVLHVLLRIWFESCEWNSILRNIQKYETLDTTPLASPHMFIYGQSTIRIFLFKRGMFSLDILYEDNKGWLTHYGSLDDKSVAAKIVKTLMGKFNIPEKND